MRYPIIDSTTSSGSPASSSRVTLAVFELNFHSGPREAREDFFNLDTVIGALDYPI